MNQLELVEHAQRRAERLWEPLRALLTHYNAVLAQLARHALSVTGTPFKID